CAKLGGNTITPFDAFDFW
nr:immunoglobulin heavy chain junction region [Macaca mulatta]